MSVFEDLWALEGGSMPFRPALNHVSSGDQSRSKTEEINLRFRDKKIFDRTFI